MAPEVTDGSANVSTMALNQRMTTAVAACGESDRRIFQEISVDIRCMGKVAA